MLEKIKNFYSAREDNIFKEILAPSVLIFRTILENLISFVLLTGSSLLLFINLDNFKNYQDYFLVLIGTLLSAICTMFFIEPIKNTKSEINYFDETEDIIDNLKSIQEEIYLEFWQYLELLPK